MRQGEGRKEEETAFLLLLELSAGRVLLRLFGPSWRRVFCRLFQDTETLFSFPHILTLWQGEALLGMALGWGSDDRRAKGLRTAFRLFPYALPRFMHCVPKLFYAGLPPSSYYLSNLAVFPPYQGKGFGKMLLQAVEEEALRLGDASVVLDVEKENSRALAFYRKNGYRTVREFLSFVRMEKPTSQEVGF